MTPLEQKLLDLNLTVMSHHLETTLSEAAGKSESQCGGDSGMACRHVELEARRGRAIERRFKCSKLQAQPSIDAFHFSHHKSRSQNKNRVLRLLDLSFFANGTNLILIGNPGVGKTFLSKIVGWRACQSNQRVLFTTAMDMLNLLLASQVDHSLVRKLKAYTEAPHCSSVTSLAIWPSTNSPPNLFYQVISTRHSQKRSTVITTNTPFSDWGNILFNTTIATAIADRLVENSEIFLFGGDSLREAQESESASGVVALAPSKRRAVAISRAGRSPPGNPSTALTRAGGSFGSSMLVFVPLLTCSTSAPIICSCSLTGRNTRRVRCSRCGTSIRSTFADSAT